MDRFGNSLQPVGADMKYCLPLLLVLSACNTTDLDAGIQRSAPYVCNAARVLYTVYTGAAAKPSQKLENAWAAMEPICAHPSEVTAAELAIAAAQYAILVAVVKREAT